MIKIDSNKEIDIDSLLDMALVQKKYMQCLPKLQVFAENGNMGAAVALMYIYFKGGSGVSKNYELARQWAEIVLNNLSEPYAAHHLGLIYYSGINGMPNRKLAYQYFMKAALQGYKGSLLIVGTMQLNEYWVKRKKKSGRIILAHCFFNKEFPLRYRFLAVFNLVTNTSFLNKYITEN